MWLCLFNFFNGKVNLRLQITKRKKEALKWHTKTKQEKESINIQQYKAMVLNKISKSINKGK